MTEQPLGQYLSKVLFTLALDASIADSIIFNRKNSTTCSTVLSIIMMDSMTEPFIKVNGVCQVPLLSDIYWIHHSYPTMVEWMTQTLRYIGSLGLPLCLSSLPSSLSFLFPPVSLFITEVRNLANMIFFFFRNQIADKRNLDKICTNG